MKKIILALVFAMLTSSLGLGVANAYYDYGYSWDNYSPSYYGYNYYPYDYAGYDNYNYDNSYPYYDYDNYGYDSYGYDYGYPYDYSSGWYDDNFYDGYDQYYNNGWDYGYVPYNDQYNWDNYQSYNNYDYGWDNNWGPMYVWNNNQNNPTFELNNYNDYFDKYNLYNYYPHIGSSKPQNISIKKIEFISREDTRKNIVIDNSRAGNCQINQARIVVSKTTFIKIQETVIKTGDIDMQIKPDHRIDFNSPHGSFQENNAAIYFSKN